MARARRHVSRASNHPWVTSLLSSSPRASWLVLLLVLLLSTRFSPPLVTGIELRAQTQTLAGAQAQAHAQAEWHGLDRGDSLMLLTTYAGNTKKKEEGFGSFMPCKLQFFETHKPEDSDKGKDDVIYRPGRNPSQEPLNVELEEAQFPLQMTRKWNTLTGQEEVQFSFVGKLKKTINPRLCMWEAQTNSNYAVFYGSRDHLYRAPLSSENGMPDVRCMEEEPKDASGKDSKSSGKDNKPTLIKGHWVTEYSTFSRNGMVIDPFSQGLSMPLCGNAVNLDEGKYYEFRGTTIQKTSQVLKCQEGGTLNITKYNMVPLFMYDCQPMYVRTHKVQPQPYEIKEKGYDAMPSSFDLVHRGKNKEKKL